MRGKAPVPVKQRRDEVAMAGVERTTESDKYRAPRVRATTLSYGQKNSFIYNSTGGLGGIEHAGDEGSSSPRATSMDDASSELQDRLKRRARRRKLSMLTVFMYKSRHRRAAYFRDLTLYVPSFFFLMVIFAHFPPNTNLLKQSEWIRTLIIEDEFTDPTNSAQKDFAKNALEVEGVDDIWDWGEAMIIGSLYDDDDSPICSAGTPLTIPNPGLTDPQRFPADVVETVIDPDIIAGCSLSRPPIPAADRVDGQPEYGLEAQCGGFRVFHDSFGSGSLLQVTSSVYSLATALVPFNLSETHTGQLGLPDYGFTTRGTGDAPVLVAVGLVLDTCEIAFDDDQVGQGPIPCAEVAACRLTNGLQQPQLLFDHNLLLGSILIQQVRSFTHRGAGRSENGCIEGNHLGNGMDTHTCYQDLSSLPVGEELEESLRPFGTHAFCPPSFNASSGELSTASRCQPGTTDCTFACAYQPGSFKSPLQGSDRLIEGSFSPPIFTEGFSVSLPRNKDAAKAYYDHIREDFVDRQTRMLAFSISLYNINLQHFTSMVVTYETDVTGQIEPYFRIKTVVPMENFMFADGFWTTITAWLWIAMQIWLVWVEFTELRALGFSTYFEDIWNKFEIIHVVIEFIFVMDVFEYLSLSGELVSSGLVNQLQRSTADILGADTPATSPYYMYGSSRYAGASAIETSAETHPTFDLNALSHSFHRVESMLGLTCMFSGLKFFKYMRLSRGLNLLWRVLDLAFWNMMVFAFVLLIICVGFGLFVTLMFGYHVREFHNVVSSMYALLNMAMGNLEYANYSDLKRASGAWTPTFIVVFLLVLILIVLNMFIAILMDYYAIARDEDLNYQKQEKAIFEGPRRKDSFTKIHPVRYDIMSMIEELWHFVFPTWKIDEQPVEHNFCFKGSDGTIQGPFFYRCAGPLAREGEIEEQTPIWFMQVRAVKSYTAETDSNLSFEPEQILIVTRQRVSHSAQKLGQTLPAGHWQGYLDGHPEHIGTFPLDAVEMIWIPYSQCKLQLQLEQDELDGICPQVQTDGMVRLTFNLCKTAYRDYHSASTTIHAGTCFHEVEQEVGKIAGAIHHQEEKMEQFVQGAVKKSELAVEEAVHHAEDAAAGAAHKAGERILHAVDHAKSIAGETVGHAAHNAQDAIGSATRKVGSLAHSAGAAAHEAGEQLGLLESGPEAEPEPEAEPKPGLEPSLPTSSWRVPTNRITTRLRVHPTKASASTLLLLGGGPRTLFRHLRPGEKVLLTEPYTLRKLDVALEFVRGDSVKYPKVMDTKKYMTFHQMEEQIATFRVSRLRSWTLWKNESTTRPRIKSTTSDELQNPSVRLTMLEHVSIPAWLNLKLWARAIREHAGEADSTVLSFLRETYREYKVKVGLLKKDAADEHGELIDEYLDAIIQAVIQGVDNEYDILELSTALKRSDMLIKDLVHRVQFHLARTGRVGQAESLDEEEVMHYINSHYNEAIVTDDEDSGDDDAIRSPQSVQSTVNEQLSEAGASVAAVEQSTVDDQLSEAGPSMAAVEASADADDPMESLRANLQRAENSLNEYVKARKAAREYHKPAGPAEDSKAGSVDQQPRPRFLTLLAQAQAHSVLKPLDKIAESDPAPTGAESTFAVPDAETIG